MREREKTAMHREGGQKKGESATAFKTSQNPVRATAIFWWDSLPLSLSVSLSLPLTGARLILLFLNSSRKFDFNYEVGARSAMIGTSKLNLFTGTAEPCECSPAISNGFGLSATVKSSPNDWLITRQMLNRFYLSFSPFAARIFR